MSSRLTSQHRAIFAAIADYLIPNAEGMPAASEVDVQGPILDRILGLRPDLAEALFRGLNKSAGRKAADAANALNMEDAEALSAIGLAASAAYYMQPEIRKRIGYPGQESRPDPDPDATPPYVANGMLQKVIDRGPIYKRTPKQV
jgi:hypothetical protein